METEVFDLPGGHRVGTGLLASTAEDVKLTSTWATFPESWLWDDKQIKEALAPAGAVQRYTVTRSRRRKRMRNQGELGKCNASSNASGMEQLREIQGMPHEPIADCYTYCLVNGGVDEGSTLPSTFSNMQKVGPSPYRLQCGGLTKLFPNNVFRKSQVPKDIWEQATVECKRFKAVRAVKLPTGDFETFCRAAATAIARGLPIIWAWHVGRSGSSLKSGYMQLAKGVGNHSNLIHDGKYVGGKTLVHPDNQNSWGPVDDPIYGAKGPSWGEGGFGLTTMEGLFSCVPWHPPYCLVSIGADENDAALSQFEAALGG
jgi:hypothetical protein